MATNNKRLLSLDVLRGLTVFVMIIVNNGAGPLHFEMLDHSKWNGLTVCDLVFPFFLFMVGVSIHLASRGLSKLSTGERIKKILLRSFKLFAIGVLLHGWDMWICGESDILANIRFWGVLERIAVCYCIGSLLYIWLNPKHLWKIAAALLVIYAVMLSLGNGYAQDGTNLAAIIDRLYLSDAHLYHKSPIDPEGLMGTISALAHTLIGVMVGRMITDKEKDLNARLVNLFVFAMGLAIIAHLISYQYPLNKRIWSPSYTLMTCAIATGMLGFLTYVIDIKGYNRWTGIFNFFGQHAFTLYILSEAMAPFGWMSGAPEFVHDNLAKIVDPRIASATYALLYDAFIGILGYAYITLLSKLKALKTQQK